VKEAVVVPLHVDEDPAKLGFDPDRFARLDRRLARYVDEGLLPGWLVLVSRHGRIAHLATYGQRDMEAGLPVELDTRWRMHSMTKPITSVAAMMLYEEGALELSDPISNWLPEFTDMRVYRRGTAQSPATDAAARPILVWHLLTHTSGLTYGFHHAHAVDEMYRAAGFEWSVPPDMDLALCCAVLAEMPLVFEPGTEWNYSMSTDVLGRLVEVVSGQPLDEFLDRRILGPLGMADTGFWIQPDAADKLAALYVAARGTRRAVRQDGLGRIGTGKPLYLSGGGGLVSTAADYHRFTQLLAGGGELDGVRLLGSRTVDMMTRNHLPGGQDLEQFGRPLFAESTFHGVGFGFGFAVLQDPVRAKLPAAAGEYSWGGAASTAFWVDPIEDITVVFLTQLLPSSTHPLRTQLHQLVYQALVDQPPGGRWRYSG
jgi:CubicO group peptidase (beta-lactamase class C family)